jgi:twitching motility protein PilT
MLANAAVRNLIREGKSYQLPNIIRMNTKNGMELLDQALVRLYRDCVISIETVYEFCNDRDDIAKITGERDTSPTNGQEVTLTTQFN